jgi:N-acetylglucosamine-1-phosphodiester alpha-N-acetylglucosaminidase
MELKKPINRRLTINLFLGLLVVIALVQSAQSSKEKSDPQTTSLPLRRDGSIVFPYDSSENWGSGRSFEEVKALYDSLFGKLIGNATGVYSIYPAASNVGSPFLPAEVKHHRVEMRESGYLVLGNLFVISNPIGRFKVHEPGATALQGCDSRTLMPVSQSSKSHNCRVATNAGFFDPFTNSATHGKCLGNLVVNGRPVRSPGTQNANFGLLKNGSFVSGYIPMDMIARDDPSGSGEKISDFETLIAGVVMLVKDGFNFVEVSATLEDSSTQTSGSIQYFCDIVTARTAIGHDSKGNLLLFVVDGRTNDQRGISLSSMADLMIRFGATNAVNLDGGGSATAVLENTCVNMPTDPCTSSDPNFEFHCERPVSSLVCIEDPQIPSNPTESPTTPPTIPPTSIPNSIPSESPRSSSIPVAWKALVIVSISVAVLSIGLLLIFVFTHSRSNSYHPVQVDLDD